MEKDNFQGISSLFEQIMTFFGEEAGDIRSYSPKTLAYIGDAVYDLMIRTLVAGKANCPPDKLHKRTIAYVNAKSQAKLIEGVRNRLSEDELSVYRRGQNAKVNSMAKNATEKDYHMATGFEALLGYLYLTNQMDRALELVKMGLEAE